MRLRIGGLAGGVLDPVSDLRASGPSVSVQIGFDLSWRYHSEGRPRIGHEEYFALVDTGASNNCIDARLAQALNLPMLGQEEFGGASGLSLANVYLAQLYIPEMEFTVYGTFLGVQLLAARQPHLALLGRDFLANFTMTYEGRTGIVVLSDE